MDAEAGQISDAVKEKLELLGGGRAMGSMPVEELQKMIHDEPFKAAYGAYGAMSESESVPNASQRFTQVPVDVNENKGDLPTQTEKRQTKGRRD
jgi:hypothetical protein